MKEMPLLIVAMILSFFVGGVGGAVLVAEKYAPESTSKSSVVPVETMTMDHTMDSMTSSLEGKTGDELDRTFLKEMITHHEGAIEMAEMVQNSEHRELRNLSAAIIKAQTREIDQMKKWLNTWFK